MFFKDEDTIYNIEREYPSKVLSAIEEICLSEWPNAELRDFKHSYATVVEIFKGKNPYFPANKLPYHDLRHTISVTLATARLLHGLHTTDCQITEQTLEKGLICALFHDIGLLKTNNVGSNKGLCKFEIKSTHEVISSEILKTFVRNDSLSIFIAEECEEIINHTNIQIITNEIICSEDAKLLGKVLGTADITAQLADRYYTECLSLLFSEMEEEESCIFNSLLDMFKRTESFIMQIEERLETQFAGIHHKYQDHFRVYQDIDKNLYLESIGRNLDYIKQIVKDNNYNINKYLRRTPPCLEEFEQDE
ncbi:MAG: HD domain-containing protein [Desulfotalea sp.]